MLSILVSRYLIKGAIKNFIIQPTISASLQLLPQPQLVKSTFLGKKISISVSDLIKFGLESITDKFLDETMEYKIEKLRDQVYKVIPANDVARLFFKEYSDEKQLVVDISAMSTYIEHIISYYESEIDLAEDELDTFLDSVFVEDRIFRQVEHDIDVVVDRASPQMLGSPSKEQQLIYEVLLKNAELINHELGNIRTKMADKLQHAGEEITTGDVITDFPTASTTPQTDEEAINQILDRLKGDVAKNSTQRQANHI